MHLENWVQVIKALQKTKVSKIYNMLGLKQIFIEKTPQNTKGEIEN